MIICLCFVFPLFSQTSTDTTTIPDTVSSKHSPRVATYLSMCLPGAGQIYNRKYWKAPIVWGGMIYFGYTAVNYQIKYRQYRKAYAAILQPIPDTSLAYSLQHKYGELHIEFGQVLEQIGFYKTQYQRNMNLCYIATFGIYFLNIIDAMVDAYFFDYNVNDNLSFHIQPQLFKPDKYSQAYGFQLFINF